jgi:hypothetical protein
LERVYQIGEKNQQAFQILVPKGTLEIATGYALAMTKRNYNKVSREGKEYKGSLLNLGKERVVRF